MKSIIIRPYLLRFCFAVIVLAIIAYMFWTSSRYPALDDKALMSGALQLEDPLSFEAYLPIEAYFPIWKKIAFTTVNWIHTNRQGMMFGILMGAAFLTLMRYLQRTSFQNPYLNSAVGLLLGAPLGVCVNCAAPIAKGMYSGGARAETALAAMISSPTLNIIVLTMAFSILPFYMAVTKIVLSVMVILIGVPLVCRFLPKAQLSLPSEEQRSCPIPSQTSGAESAMQSIKGFLSDFATDLWYIFRLTVPLMILAGFLGAIVATVVPIETLSTFGFGLAALCLVALIGTFLPVPMAFDVVICGALLAAGLPVGYVMTLLFTLGIFSIYSYFIIGEAISIRAASLMYLVVFITGICAGLGANHWHNVKTKQALELLTTSSQSVSPKTVASSNKEPASEPIKVSQLNTSKTQASEIDVIGQPFSARSPKGNKPFTRLEAREIGIDKPIEFSMRDMWPPFWEGRSLSAGDYDNDGDYDLVLASTVKGLYFYKNDGTGQFTRDEIDLGLAKDWPIFNAAFVDIDNDGWLDVFLTTYKRGNFIIPNNAGSFDASAIKPVKNRPGAMLTLALSFSDIDQDGDLDVGLGNWAAGWYRRLPGEESRNRILFNESGVLDGSKFADLPGIPGETLSILFTDIDNDQDADLLVGNDFEIPDIYYLGDGAGAFKRIRPEDEIIPVTTTTTMAIKNNDLNNDLVPEIYLAQIAGRATGVKKRLNMRPIEQYCDDVGTQRDQQVCLKNMAIKVWYKSGNNFNPSYANRCQSMDPVYQAECKAMLTKDLAIQAEDPTICGLIKEDQPYIRAFCDIHFLSSRPLTNADVRDNFPQIKHQNVLLSRKDDGSYNEVATHSGLEVGGWSWDTKIDDFDNDEWSDVYIVNGTWVPNEVTPSNMYYSNQGQGEFKEMAEPFGIDDYHLTAAAIKLDIDNDGDLDLVTMPVNAPAKVFINNNQTGNAVRFEIRDEISNHFGVGAKVIIQYGSEGEKTQMREIQLGGGFQSFDASYAHFGLGEHDNIRSFDVLWADGSKNSVEGPFEANHNYLIHRRAGQ